MVWDGLGWSGANRLVLGHSDLDGPPLLGRSSICPGSLIKNKPIRLNLYEEQLSLIGSEIGWPEVMEI
jgi:hypothetical protein